MGNTFAPPTNQINDYEKLIVDYNNPQHLYVIISTHNISNAGYLAKSTDEGVTWTSYQIATSDQFSVWTGCIDPNNSSIFYAGRNDSPNFYKSTNGGINWNAVTLQTGGLGVVDISVAKQNSSNMFICLNNGDDTSKYLMKSEDAGQTWSKSFGNGFIRDVKKCFQQPRINCM